LIGGAWGTASAAVPLGIKANRRAINKRETAERRSMVGILGAGMRMERSS
jgi:hypothetical protein